MFQEYHQTLIGTFPDVTCEFKFTLDEYCNPLEIYNNPEGDKEILGGGSWSCIYGSNHLSETERCQHTGASLPDPSYWRVAIYLDLNSNQLKLVGHSSITQQLPILFFGENYNDGVHTTSFSDRNLVPSGMSGSMEANIQDPHWSFTSNVPFFGTDYTHAQAYANETNAGLAQALLREYAYNYKEYVDEMEGDDFEITNPYIEGTWTQYGVSTTGNIAYRNVRGKINTDGILAFYKIPFQYGDTALKYGIVMNAEFSGLQYSVDGINWQNVDSFPFDFFYRERTDEIGTFKFAYVLGFSRFTVWENQEDAIGFIQGEKDIEEALNWPEISGGYPVFNPTGDEEEETDFGQVYTEGFFSQQYILNATAVREIANGLFDTQSQGIWESIKKGIEMFGADPIQAVMGLSYWPFSLTDIFTDVSSQNYVYFGGFKFDFTQTGSSCSRIIHPNGYKTIAQTHMIKRRFHSWRDFEPYTKLYIMLPYIGTYQLDLARYYDKVLEVRYYCDTRTNSVIAALIADGTLIDYFNGQMGCTMPITLTDYSGFANSQINTLLGAGGQAANAFGNGISQAPVMAGSAAGFVGGAAGVALSGAAVGAKTVYGLSQNNINNFNKTKGGSTSMINQYLPQKVILIWEMMEDCAPANYGQMFGYPSMMSGKLSSFSGFLKCQAVKLECGIATERERERLKSMLLSGIYI